MKDNGTELLVDGVHVGEDTDMGGEDLFTSSKSSPLPFLLPVHQSAYLNNELFA